MQYAKGAKIYFRRGQSNFAGIVVSSSATELLAKSVELGCQWPESKIVSIGFLEGLMVVDHAQWEKLTENEPAFADAMTLDRFIALQREIEQLDAAVAAGQDTDQTLARIELIDLLMAASPWTLHPDYGCVSKNEAALLGALEEIDARIALGWEDAAQFCRGRAARALQDATDRRVMP